MPKILKNIGENIFFVNSGATREVRTPKAETSNLAHIPRALAANVIRDTLECAR